MQIDDTGDPLQGLLNIINPNTGKVAPRAAQSTLTAPALAQSTLDVSRALDAEQVRKVVKRFEREANDEPRMNRSGLGIFKADLKSTR